MTESLRSPLHACHADAGGRMIDFGGWRLPVHYGSILTEGRAVRTGAGMFDVSHMGRFDVRGPRALDVLQRLGTNDLTRIGPGRAQYTLWCNPDGGVIDDLIVFWMRSDEFMVVVNGSTREDDWAHLSACLDGTLAVDETQDTAMIAVQGPRAREIVAALGAAEVLDMKRFAVVRTTVAGTGAIVSRTGYTGEDGVELVTDAGAGPRVWEALREAGVVPCGLGARDALRMEMGYPLYGHELGPDVSPLEAGLDFAVRLEGRDFIGSEALRKHPPERRLVGFVASKRCVPQPGDAIGAATVTSGGTSVVLDAPIGLAFAPLHMVPGPATLVTRGKEIPCEVRELPLIDRSRPIPATATVSS
ncbi:MAG TPA: glycine cleavage system aminomethyltransferase GcvT [Actinomycetota bacterium]|nr:glycine cleavage system aminomethyltransferase GcvT [Actinomycetota bacterium]